MNLIGSALVVFSAIAFAYFVALNAVYLIFTAVAWREVTYYHRAREFSGAEEAFASPLTPPISILVPAYNEEAGIVESVRSLLGLRYPELEVIVVNDGSTDGTLERLIEAFDLVSVRKASRDSLATEAVRGSYASRQHHEVWVIDKENGGKADALNAGVNAARYPYFCAVDADAMLEPDALLRVAKPMLDDPELVVASGGIVRIANGCRVDHGQVVDVALPRSRLATLQVVEYLRAFLVGRMGWSRAGSLLIISGAFGLFQRSLVAVAGGYSTTTVGEDVELVVRLHHFLRERGEEYRVQFIPDPVAWTEVPEDFASLSSQRRRWQRGLAEALWRHRRVFLRPSYGIFGMVAVPCFFLFEVVGPAIEILGYPAVAAGGALGRLSFLFLAAFFIVAVLVGALLSVSALALEEFNFRRYPRGREAGRLLVAALGENLGYRQLNALWRALALVDVARGRKDWGQIRRRGLGYGAAGGR
jgi:cellulose synthase/poly-beta-1,6-N-acetylglucosamine synthase-like glycosyltransferase